MTDKILKLDNIKNINFENGGIKTITFSKSIKKITDLDIIGKDMKIGMNNIENLVFEGGGVKGIAFAGAMKHLEELNILKNIKCFAGSSAGSIIASALACGMSSREIDKLLRNTNFNQFKDGARYFPKKIKNLWRLLTKYGFYKGDAMLLWLHNVLKNQTGKGDITFQGIYKKYGKELVITGVNLNQSKSVYFNRILTPDMSVALAARISSSIPLVFNPVKHNGEYYIDGGYLNNYPIWYFDEEENKCNPKTIGFKLMGEAEKKDNLIFHTVRDINNIYDYGSTLINTLQWQIERSHVKEGYWERTVAINTFNINSTDFNITEIDKQKLYKSGYDATKKFFTRG